MTGPISLFASMAGAEPPPAAPAEDAAAFAHALLTAMALVRTPVLEVAAAAAPPPGEPLPQAEDAPDGDSSAPPEDAAAVAATGPMLEAPEGSEAGLEARLPRLVAARGPNPAATVAATGPFAPASASAGARVRRPEVVAMKAAPAALDSAESGEVSSAAVAAVADSAGMTPAGGPSNSEPRTQHARQVAEAPEAGPRSPLPPMAVPAREIPETQARPWSAEPMPSSSVRSPAAPPDPPGQPTIQAMQADGPADREDATDRSGDGVPYVSRTRSVAPEAAEAAAAPAAVPQGAGSAEEPHQRPGLDALARATRSPRREHETHDPAPTESVVAPAGAAHLSAASLAVASQLHAPMARRATADQGGAAAGQPGAGLVEWATPLGGQEQGSAAGVVRPSEGQAPGRIADYAGALAEILGHDVRGLVVERGGGNTMRPVVGTDTPVADPARADAPAPGPHDPATGIPPERSASLAREPATAPPARPAAPEQALHATAVGIPAERPAPLARGPETVLPARPTLDTAAGEGLVEHAGSAVWPASAALPLRIVEPAAAAPAISRQAVVAGLPGPAAPPIMPVARQELPPPVGGRRSASEPEQTGAGEEVHEPTSTLAALSGPGAEPMRRADGLQAPTAPREARNLPNEGDVAPRAAGLADRVTITVAGDDGRPTRIRVAVVGEQVRATITPPDGESARQLERRMDDLTAALVRRGFAEPRVTIQRAAEPGPVWAGAAHGVRTDVEVPRGTEQPAGDQRQGSGRREQERQGDGQQRHPHGRSRQRDPDDRGR